MKTHFVRLFQYDLWANRRVLDSLHHYPLADTKIFYWFSHLLNAEQIWLDRMQKGSTEVDPHTVHPLSQCRGMMEAIHENYLHWLDALPEGGLYETVTYHNTRGDSFRNEVHGILSHVINHSTHHRAQIVAKTRSLGFAPPVTDLIFYLRNQDKS